MACSSTVRLCWYTSLWRWCSSRSSRSADSSGSTRSANPVCTSRPRPGRGGSVSTSLDSSSRIRSADTMAIRSAIAVIASITRGAGWNTSWEVNRAARIIRSGSSENDCSGVPGVSISPCGKVRQTTVRVHEPLARQLDGHRVDGEVAPDQVTLQGVPEPDLGLAAVGDVDVGAEGRHLDDPALDRRSPTDRRLVDPAADCAELLADGPHRRGDRPQDPLDVVGPGVGGEVEIVAELAAKCVADAAADEIEGEPCVREQPAQPVGDRGDPQQLGSPRSPAHGSTALLQTRGTMLAGSARPTDQSLGAWGSGTGGASRECRNDSGRRARIPPGNAASFGIVTNDRESAEPVTAERGARPSDPVTNDRISPSRSLESGR